MQFLQLSHGLGFTMGKGDSRRVVAPEMGASEITLNYSVFEPGQEFPQHRHDHSEDCFVVLKGGASLREGDRYTPISAGDAVWVPVADVHGTVNTTDSTAVLISFQSPPDGALYRGERDSSRASVPAPPAGVASRVQIRRMDTAPKVPLNGLAHSAGSLDDGATVRRVVSRATGAQHLEIDYIHLAASSQIEIPATGHEQVVVIVQGDVTPRADRSPRLAEGQAIFLEPADSVSLAAGGAGATLIRAAATG